MKILFLNTSSIGGAALAAKRIAASVEMVGHEVVFLNQVDFVYYGEVTVLARIIDILKVFTIRILRRSIQILSRKSYVSTMLLGTVSVNRINESDFDLVHVHWVNGGFVSVDQIKRINKPVVWTVHDMWITTGFRHVVLEGSKPYFIERIFSWRNIKLLDSSKKLHMVAPSKWLGEKIKNMYRLPISVIPNPISFSEGIVSSVKLNKSNQVLFLHTSNEFHKGYDLLREALNIVSLTNEVELLTVLKDIGDDVNFKVKEIDYMSESSDVLEVISSVRMVVVPSRVDNYPNVCLEAIVCKVPVVAFRIGGIPEIVSHLETGYLADPFDVYDLAAGIRSILDNTIEFKFPENANLAVSIGALYNEIYQELIES